MKTERGDDGLKESFVHVYTGNGKGKTTAALGLTIRAAGAGKKILFAQFLKTGTFCEHTALSRFADLVTVRCYGTGDFIRNTVRPDHREAAREGFADLEALVRHGMFDLVVCDELTAVINYGMIMRRDVEKLVGQRPVGCEIVITGRGAPDWLVDCADLVTEMREVRHYYHAGVKARRGIEM